jgi:hypothetical protein
MNTFLNNKKAIIVVGVVVAVAAVVGLAAAYNNKRTAKNVNPAGPVTQQASLPALQLNARNTLRKNEVSQLLSGVSEFMSNNSGQLPTTYSQGTFSSPSGEYVQTTRLTHYSNVAVVSGPQQPVSSDEVRLVTGAACGSNGATVPASTRAVAAQYGLEQENGSFKPQCIDT